MDKIEELCFSMLYTQNSRLAVGNSNIVFRGFLGIIIRNKFFASPTEN